MHTNYNAAVFLEYKKITGEFLSREIKQICSYITSLKRGEFVHRKLKLSTDIYSIIAYNDVINFLKRINRYKVIQTRIPTLSCSTACET